MSTRKKKPTAAQLNAERKLLAECLPDDWVGDWLEHFDYQNTMLLEDGEEPLSHCEFIRCRLEDLALGQMVWRGR